MESSCTYLRFKDADLFTMILLPDGGGKYPTVIMRSPYVDKFEEIPEEEVLAEYAKDLHLWCERGYAVVAQHCRGRGKSTGDCIPYINERDDGLYLQQWIRQQPFYDGTLLLEGASYKSSVHLTTHPFAPDIKGAVFNVQDYERYNICYRNGCMKKGLHGRWYFGMYKAKSHMVKNKVSWDYLPFSGFSEAVLGEPAEDFNEMIRHPDPADPFWQTHTGGSDARYATDDPGIPLLLSTGHYDIFTGGVYDMWDKMAPRTKAMSALYVSADDHGDHTELMPIHFPDGDRKHSHGAYAIDWFDWVLGRREKAPFEPGKVTFYRLFDNVWDCGQVKGDSEMTLKLSGGRVTYTYDPNDAPCFRGGLSANFGGPAFQDPPGTRKDVISVYTAPFERDVFVKGAMKARLRVSSDCEDTCFFVRVDIEKPEGDFGLRDDITTLLFRKKEYRPGDWIDLDFNFDEHAFRIRRGERLRIDIASADNTNYVRHTNLRGLYSEQTHTVIAHNSVDLDECTLTLPIENEYKKERPVMSKPYLKAPMDGSKVIFAAHRGDKKRFPENTMPAFIAAFEQGVDMIETDIHMTADGELVIMHDRSALRTCGVDRNLDEMTLAEIRELDAGAIFSPAFAGTKVPTVREFLEWIRPTGMMVNWELKDYPTVLGEEKAYLCADKLSDLIEEYGMAERSMVNSFSSRVLEHFVRKVGHRYPVHGQGIHTAPRSKDTPDIPPEELFDWCCTYPTEKGKLCIDSPENFAYCVEHNILPCICIPDTVEYYRRALELGCRMFTSNDTIEGDRVLRELGVR